MVLYSIYYYQSALFYSFVSERKQFIYQNANNLLYIYQNANNLLFIGKANSFSNNLSYSAHYNDRDMNLSIK